MVVADAEDRYVGFVTRLVEEGQRDGSIRADADPRLVRMVVLGAVNWVYRWYREGGAWGTRPPGDRNLLTLAGRRVQPRDIVSFGQGSPLTFHQTFVRFAPTSRKPRCRHEPARARIDLGVAGT